MQILSQRLNFLQSCHLTRSQNFVEQNLTVQVKHVVSYQVCSRRFLRCTERLIWFDKVYLPGFNLGCLGKTPCLELFYHAMSVILCILAGLTTKRSFTIFLYLLQSSFIFVDVITYYQ